MTSLCATFFSSESLFHLNPRLRHEKYASAAERSAKIRQAIGEGKFLRIEAHDVTFVSRLDPASKRVTTYQGLFDFDMVPLEYTYDEPAPCAATSHLLSIHFGPVAPSGRSARVLCPSHAERMKLVKFVTERAPELNIRGRRVKVCGLALVDTTVAYDQRPDYVGRRCYEPRLDLQVQAVLSHLIAEHACVDLPVLV